MRMTPMYRNTLRRVSMAILLGAGLFATGGQALAQAGMPDTRKMSCADVRALVAKRGAVLLATGPNTFDRYVRDNSFCSYPDQVDPQWVPTLDGSCNVGGGRCWDPSIFYGNR